MHRYREPIPDDLLERIGRDHGRHLFVPSHYDFDDPEGLAAFVRDYPLGQMFSSDGTELRATAAAFLVTAPADAPANVAFDLLGHLARRNPHADLVQDGATAVIVFQGPSSYVSPRWNRENPSLPTWSYLAVQVRGRFEPFTDLDATRSVLERTIAHMEREAEPPWRLEDAPPELVDKLIRHIVAFRFRVADVQGVARLNQNRQPADRAGIIDGLRATGAPGALQIAELMADAERDT